MDRRHFLIGTAVAGTAGLFAVKPTDAGQSYSPYFSTLNTMLKNEGTGKPALIIDLDKLDKNIDTLVNTIPRKTKYRVVVKSVPSPSLVKYIMDRAETNKLMVFHQPFLNQIANDFPKTDVLLGKPMPVKAAERFYQNLSTDNQFNHQKDLQWLIDSEKRLDQYLQLAKKLDIKMNINFELDVGLHRGGLQAPEQLTSLIKTVTENPKHLSFSGFMGYDPQIIFFPPMIKSIETAYEESQGVYLGFIDHIRQHHPDIDIDALCINGAGSFSMAEHQEDTVINDISAGSCLLKPTQFDVPGLHAFDPSSYVATPILKKMNGTNVPGLESFKTWHEKWDPNKQQTLFVYGGKWKAHFESPAGLQNNDLYGTSTNQMIVNCSRNTQVNVDDHVFLRPDQSEFVLLQFGDLVMYRNNKIQGHWPILSDS